MDNNEQQQQEQGGKVEKQFEQNMTKLIALFNGDKSAFKSKLPNDGMAAIVEELLKERKEQTKQAFKTKASELLDKKVAFDRFVANAEKELKKTIQEKMKEFNKEMDACFSMVESIDKLAGEYMKTLNQHGKGSEEAQV